jgi:ABC-2 type transport system ATP-binding protein
MTPALHFENVSKRYGRQVVLDNFSLTVRAGEFVGLVGVNGAGKTTLIKCLLDFCDIDGGRIEIFGTNHTRTEARARLAFLPERFAAPPFARGDEFLRYLMGLHGRPYDSTAIQETLAALDLDRAALSKPVRQLSKGMSQKLGLMTTLLSGKELLVLDEPMSGLDPKARALLKRHLFQLKERGHTLFFSTHLLPDVSALCDRMAILHGGGLRYVGRPEDCCAAFGADTLETAYLRCLERSDA